MFDVEMDYTRTRFFGSILFYIYVRARAWTRSKFRSDSRYIHGIKKTTKRTRIERVKKRKKKNKSSGRVQKTTSYYVTKFK